MPGPTSTDQNLEQTFAHMAFARLRDKAPTLLDYLVGFQLIDKNDDETHAVGVFGFKVGKDWVYAPVFFINGELKGHELMYVQTQDAFVPMTEPWVNYILNRRPRVLGALENRAPSELSLRQPDFNILARTPYLGSKTASDNSRSFSTICSMLQNKNPDMLPFMSVFTVGPKHEKFAKLNTSFTLPSALKALGKQAAINLMATMQKDTDFAEAILRHYPVEDLVNVKFAAELDTVAENQRKGKDTIPSPVVILRGDDGSNVEENLTDDEKSQLIKNKYVVRDPREEGQKSKLYKTQIAATMNSPFKTGVYDVYAPNGSTKKTLVLVSPTILGWGCSRHRAMVVAIDLDNKNYGNFSSADLLTTKWYGQEEFEKVYNSASALSSLGVDDQAVLITSNGHATGSFTVNTKTTNADGLTELRIYGHNSPASSSALRKDQIKQSPPSSLYDDDINSIVFTDREGDKITRIGSSIFVPKDFKAFIIKKAKKRSKSEMLGACAPCFPENSEANFGVGSWNDMVFGLKKTAGSNPGLAQLQLKTDGIRYTPVINGIHGPRLSKVAALKFLVEGQGLGQEDAEFLVKEASPRKAETFWVKYAYGLAPMSATFPEQEYGSEIGVPVRTTYPQQEMQNLGQEDYGSNRELYRNDRYIDNDAKSYANTASQMGQKEVLDTAVISGLVKTMDTGSKVDGYISDLLLGLDRLGRILFMYYWHNDKFKERYGQQDMAELEDNLRNVFKNLGELTIFLKQKTVEADPAMTSEVQLTDVIS